MGDCDHPALSAVTDRDWACLKCGQWLDEEEYRQWVAADAAGVEADLG